MGRHKLSMSVDYVKQWGVQEALRELFQNALDHGVWSHVYDAEEQILSITSHQAQLPARTILLGTSEKPSGSRGKFGEGYKLALLVLTRLRRNVTVRTGQEIWKPKLINSRTYGTQQLVIDTETVAEIFPHVVFAVSGITQDDYDELKKRNLHVCPSATYIAPHILNEEHAGRVYVGGLYVCTIPELRYGYDFSPEQISLDRDRCMASTIDVAWETCALWAEGPVEDAARLVDEGALDVKYLKCRTYAPPARETLGDHVAREFYMEHGPEAVPVTTQTELEECSGKAVLVPEVKNALIRSSSLYVPAPPPLRKRTPREALEEFDEMFCNRIFGDMRLAFDALLEESDDWTV